MKATQGHTSIINFITTPSWMFKLKEPIPYPANPNEFSWGYGYGGKELRDSTMNELTGYFTRIVSWYTNGGFTDELGRYHYSGHHYKIPYWEVFNEPDAERGHSPESYTKQYDAIVTAIRKVSPDTKFVSMGSGSSQSDFLEMNTESNSSQKFSFVLVDKKKTIRQK
jgi:hypothetical protein